MNFGFIDLNVKVGRLNWDDKRNWMALYRWMIWKNLAMI